LIHRQLSIADHETTQISIFTEYFSWLIGCTLSADSISEHHCGFSQIDNLPFIKIIFFDTRQKTVSTFFA